MFNRRRFNIRKIVTIKNATILVASISIVFFVVSMITAHLLNKKIANSTVAYTPQNLEENNLEDENSNSSLDLTSNENTEDTQNTQENILENEASDNTSSINQNISLNILGEIMMGGQVGKNLEYNYSEGVKKIYSVTRMADFTYANFSTNITNLETIENPKSKYIVTKNITSALEALGLDSVSIASDHIVDFDSDVLSTTTSLIEASNIFVAGRENMPVYFEKDGKKIAIVSTNSVIIGTAKNYTKNEISVYSYDNLKKNIEEAKEAADIVIADIHWGRDTSYGVTNQMKEIAYGAIDSGADMVIGTHALGIYPVSTYKDKPIIYSTGYLMTDLDYTVAKEGFIFSVNIDADMKISSLEMIPTYILDKKEVMLYNEYDPEQTVEYLKQYNNWNIENGLNSKIVNNKIVIDF